MKNRFLLIFLAAPALFSCSKDPGYSIHALQNIDPEITLFENGLTVPADTLMNFKLDEFFKADRIVKDKSGNYFIDADVPQTSQKFEVIPEISIPKLLDDHSWNYSTGEYAGCTVPSGFSFTVANLEGGPRIGFEYQLPAEIFDIRSIELEFPISIEIAATSPMAYLCEGFTVQFPKGFRFEKRSTDTWYDVEFRDNVCKLVINKDISVPGKLSCDLTLSGIDVQTGWIQGKTLSMSERLSVKGSFGLKGPGTVPEVAGISFYPVQGSVKVKGADIKVNTSVSMPSKTVDLNLPPEITAEGNVFKFTDTGLDLALDNNTPFPISVSGKLEAVRKEGIVPEPARITGLPIRASGKTVLHIDESVCPGILDILNCLPDQIIVRDFVARCSSDDFFKVYADRQNEVSVSGTVHLPLSFSKGTRFKIEKTFKNKLDFDASASVSKLGIRIELTNNFPVDIEAILKIQIDGQMMQIETKDQSPIKVEAGKTADMTLIAGKPDGSSFTTIGDLEMSAAASVSSGLAVLNANDGLSIRVKSVSAPDGITLKLK